MKIALKKDCYDDLVTVELSYYEAIDLAYDLLCLAQDRPREGVHAFAEDERILIFNLQK